MREVIEFRIPEEAARRVLSPQDGTLLGGSVRRVELSSTDDRVALIRDAEAEYRARGEFFFTAWNVTRHYSRQELDSADVLRLTISRAFEPAGAECGTRYSDSEACPICGAGDRQIGDLRLDLRRVPKGVDLARSIADEWIGSQRFAEALLDGDLTGLELGRVLHRTAPTESVDLSSVPAGRELLEEAEAHGIVPDSWEYWVWLNRAENHEALEAARAEAEPTMRAAGRLSSGLAAWHQLQITAPPVPVVAPTRFGADNFDEDPLGEHRCPLGHVAGLNLLSELHLPTEDLPQTDFAITQQLVGDRRGLLRPAPLLLVSQRARNVLVAHRIKGYGLEVVHLVA
jgi:hypothetical protein